MLRARVESVSKRRALVVALAEGHPLAEAVRFANAAAGLACTQRGAQNSLPVRTQVESFLAGTRA